MGAKFSADAEDAQILVRDKQGRFTIYTGKMDTATSCSELPVPLVPLDKNDKTPVQFLFFPSSNYHGKNLHLHTFYDNDCETPANDLVTKEVNVLKKKNINHMKQTAISNSTYFELNEDPINTPLYPMFIREENGVAMPRYTKRSAYSNCTLIPYPAVNESKTNPRKKVDVDHNTVPMRMYTDNKCKNEYVNILDAPNNFNQKSNVDDQDVPINDNLLTMKYTNVKAYVDPAIKSNAMYYRTFRKDYP
jgi:hypothetical protein